MPRAAPPNELTPSVSEHDMSVISDWSLEGVVARAIEVFSGTNMSSQPPIKGDSIGIDFGSNYVRVGLLKRN